MQRNANWIMRALVGVVLTVHCLLALDCARYWSVTHDEYWHLPLGLHAWTTGRFDVETLNPPLTRMWAAIPLLATSASLDAPDDGDVGDQGLARFGDRFLEANPSDHRRLFLLGRGMNILLSAAVGLLLAIWARQLWGPAAACAAAGLWAFSPSAIAGAALVTPDIGATLLFTATLYAAWRYARRPTWRSALLFGALLGVAQLTKFTAVLLYPLAAGVWIIVRVRSGSASTHFTPGDSPGIKWLQWAAALVLSLVVLNAGYLFQGFGTPLAEYSFRSRPLSVLNDVDGSVGALPIPLPRPYLEGLDGQKAVMESNHPVYLDGRWSTDGFPHYYLMVLLYKLPHAVQALFVLVVVFLVFPGGQPRHWRTQLVLLLPVVLLLGIASTTSMQLGLRYLLPAVPFLFLFAAQTVRWRPWTAHKLRTAAVLLLLLLLPLSLRHHPHHIAYFNELSGGPAAGRQHLIDSNLDWGQDLRGLKRWMEAQGVDRIGLAYFGTFPPAALGIDYQLPPSRRPRPGLYAVSANFLQGRPHSIREPSGEVHPVGFDEFGYFRRFRPVARIGASIEIYEVGRPGMGRNRTRTDTERADRRGSETRAVDVASRLAYPSKRHGIAERIHEEAGRPGEE